MADRMTDSAELRCGAVAAELRDRAAKLRRSISEHSKALADKAGELAVVEEQISIFNRLAAAPERLLRYVLLPDGRAIVAPAFDSTDSSLADTAGAHRYVYSGFITDADFPAIIEASCLRAWIEQRHKSRGRHIPAPLSGARSVT